MPNITEPLRLAVGSHQKGSGKGCAMNVISWENGDQTITDMPACADPVLARIVQNVNDRLCDHREGDLLCPDCSVKVLELAHRTVGTGEIELSVLKRRQVWVAIAANQARQVLHLVIPAHREAALACINAAEAWADDPTEANKQAAIEARRNLSAYAYAYADVAVTTAAYDAVTAAYAAADVAVTTAAYDAAAAAAAAAAAYDATRRLELAHRAIDLFEKLTGHTTPVVEPAVIAAAVCNMKETVNV